MLFFFSFNEGVRDDVREMDPQLGTQFTCFIGTNVRKLTQKELRCCGSDGSPARYSVYLLYWHNSAKTDAEVLCCERGV